MSQEDGLGLTRPLLLLRPWPFELVHQPPGHRADAPRGTDQAEQIRRRTAMNWEESSAQFAGDRPHLIGRNTEGG